MNTKIIMMIVGAAVVVGGATYFLGQDSTRNQEGDTNTEQTSEVAERELSETGFGSFSTLLGLGRNLKCEFTYNDEANGDTSTGHFYYDSGTERFRVDSQLVGQSGTYNTHVINDTTLVYLWTSGPEGNFAMKMEATEYTKANTGGSMEAYKQKQFSVNEEVEYDCQTWPVDESLLVPPADIEFMNMAEMMQGVMQNMPEGFEMPTI